MSGTSCLARARQAAAPPKSSRVKRSVRKRAIYDLLRGRLVIELILPVEDEARRPRMWNRRREERDCRISLALAAEVAGNESLSHSDQLVSISHLTPRTDLPDPAPKRPTQVKRPPKFPKVECSGRPTLHTDAIPVL